MDVLRKRNVQSSIPEMAFKMAGLIQPKSAVARIKQYVLKELSSTKHAWADEAVRRMEDDLLLLDRFYQDQEASDQEAYQLEQVAIKEQYQQPLNSTLLMAGCFTFKVRKIKKAVHNVVDIVNSLFVRYASGAPVISVMIPKNPKTRILASETATPRKLRRFNSLTSAIAERIATANVIEPLP
ncbi:hypothetical protein JCM19055_1537 [Geomicrobium sp. JCM 19055]|nr:hypothetical protein JCM19055_1537 [Geomicrobium sp. JCM 19055]